MRILHLAYEDPLQPGSGGGSIRAREINRRLAGRHEITALVAGYPGAKPRVEDGVRWVPVGPRTGTKFDRLAYFPRLWPEVARRPFDLLVEEFGAPFGANLSPLFTSKPIVASVQWLFASEMRQKYRGLPFDAVEKRGLRLYDRFVAVSDWLADDLRERSLEAVVETIPNGVEQLAYETEPEAPKHLLFIGRPDIGHKGGDLFFDILVRVKEMRGGDLPPVVIAGDGPDRGVMEKMARRSGFPVEFVGRVEAAEKYRLMASSHAVLMPSRYETFGMVALETLAVGAPLVAFDVGPLGEVAGEGSGARLVPPYDLDAFAGEVVRLTDDPSLRERLREDGRRWARRYDWDEISARQEEFYLRAVEEHARKAGRRPAAPPTKPRSEEPREEPRVGGPLDGGVLSPVLSAGRGRPAVLLVGNYGNGNAGDEAILARLLELVGDGARVMVLSRDPRSVERTHGVTAVRTLSLASMRAFLKADVLAIGGGGVFGYGMQPLPRLLPGVALLARLMGKKTAYLAVGAYPGMPPLVRRLLGVSAVLSAPVAVRDPASLETLDVRVMGVSSEPVLVRDPAMDLTPAPEEEAVRLLRAHGAAPASLGLAIKATPSPESNERMLSALMEAVDWWCEHRTGDVVLFAFSGRTDYGLEEAASDRALSERLLRTARAPGRLRIVGPGVEPRVLKAAVGLLRGMIGVRLHAQIFAWSMGRPLLGLSFEEKSDAFLRSVGAQRIGLSSLHPQAVIDWLERL